MKIDTISPTTSDLFTDNGKWVSADPTIVLSPGDPTPSSGIAWTKYCQDAGNGSACTPSIDYPDGGVLITTEGTSYFRYASADIAGNVEPTVSLTVMIDTTPQVTQVLISPITTTAPGVISPEVTITNEGHFDYEYRYDFCVQSATNFDPNSACTSGDVYPITTNSKEISAGASFNPTLTATISNAGSYYFKVITHYGTGYSQSSSASQPFTLTAATPPNNGGGGGGGGGGSGIIISPIIPTPTKCNGKADLNHDCKVNLVDFSIMAYWYGRANPPASVDLNGDKKVNLIDFSIMAYYWTK